MKRLFLVAVLIAVNAFAMSFVTAWAGECAPPRSRYFRTSDGVRLHYLESGAGRPLVFVPGWTLPARIWLPQIQHFSRQFRVIALDPRSQGESDIAAGGHDARRRAQDIHELIEHVRAGPPVLVGWSLAVLESLAMIHYFGDDGIAALVLVDNSVGEDPPPTARARAPVRSGPDREAQASAFVRSMFRTPQDAAYLDELTRQALRTPADVGVALMSYDQPRTFWKDALYATRKPILYAVTARFAGQAQNVRTKHPSATVEIFPSAGHALFVDEARRFNSVLEGFICRNLECPARVSENKCAEVPDR